MNIDSHTDDEIRDILNMKKVAVIGMSKYNEKAAHFVPKYLLQNGYDVTPVNPTAEEILDKKCYTEVTEIPYDVDIVDIFRPSEDVPSVINGVLKKKGLMWQQKHAKRQRQLAPAIPRF